jgi:hypothetical protein
MRASPERCCEFIMWALHRKESQRTAKNACRLSSIWQQVGNLYARKLTCELNVELEKKSFQSIDSCWANAIDALQKDVCIGWLKEKGRGEVNYPETRIKKPGSRIQSPASSPPASPIAIDQLIQRQCKTVFETKVHYIEIFHSALFKRRPEIIQHKLTQRSGYIVLFYGGFSRASG